MFTLAVVLISFSLSILRVSAQACNANTLCPASAPCCSEHGFCGSTSQFCLAGCNPFASHSLDSCKPSPVCKSQDYTFKDNSRILTDASQFNGNPDTYDWIVEGGNVEVKDNNLVMILTETNAGTLLSSTRFIHYGTVTATMKTGRWDGVVVGFITMSNVHDEIDWEFPGNKVTQGQTNFFWQGVNPHGDVSDGLTDTYKNFHDYTIQWTPDALVFQIDGKTVRTLKASDFVKNGVSQFPSTPSRIQLSLWPAGTSASGGTVEWAGGMVDWNNKDYVAAGNQFRTYVKSISVTCADPQAPTSNQISYVYAQGSTSNQPKIELSTNSPVMNGVSSGSSGTTTGSTTGSTSSSTTTSTTAATRSRMMTSYVASATGVPNSGGTGDDSGGFFGNSLGAVASSTYLDGGDGASSTDSVLQSQSTDTATAQSTQPPTTSPNNNNKSGNGAHSQHAGVIPVLSVTMLLVLAIVL